jgi:MFS family permease
MSEAAAPVAGDYVVDVKRDRLVIVASSLGTVFEWYDFFIYGTLAPTIAALFFPSTNPTAGLLLTLATFGAGFGVRPIGAVLFGVLGDRLGRKYTFLVTITLMGVATAAVGMLPIYSEIGLLAPILLVTCRLLQGLALGGEYGGAAIYVAEHAPRNRRGVYTSFIQAGVIGGFLLSVVVVLTSNAVAGPGTGSWAWRVPFLVSLLLLAVSLWVRLKLKESPVFQAMKEAGEVARNPLRESFKGRRQVKLLFVALFGVAAGLTVIWYTAQFQALYFLRNSLRIEDNAALMIIGIAAFFSVFWFVLFGWLSDRIGRKPPIVTGYVLTILLMFPLFHWMANAANPELSAAMARNPVTVQGTNCDYNPFAAGAQATPCARALDALTRRGIAYTVIPAPGWRDNSYQVRIGTQNVNAEDPAALEPALEAAGYRLEKSTPPFWRTLQVVLAIIVIGMLSGMTFGPVAALLVEMFPARIRYTSVSVPYHIGTGYFGGFLPFISQYVVARSGDPFAGLWYTIAVVAMALVVTLFWLPETAGKNLD